MSPNDNKPLPAVLPKTPTGFTKRMTVHMSFEGGGTGHYLVHGPEGQTMPFAWQYDTRPGGKSGFSIKGRDGLLNWSELVAYWPEFIAAQAVPA